MKIYRYNQKLIPRPPCVVDGGYAYDPVTDLVLGFGMADSDYKISVADAKSHYDSVTPEVDAFGGIPPTADEFLASHGIE